MKTIHDIFNREETIRPEAAKTVNYKIECKVLCRKAVISFQLNYVETTTIEWAKKNSHDYSAGLSPFILGDVDVRLQIDSGVYKDYKNIQITN